MKCASDNGWRGEGGGDGGEGENQKREGLGRRQWGQVGVAAGDWGGTRSFFVQLLYQLAGPGCPSRR